MSDVELVLPNLADFRSRGKLGERCALAERLGCQIVEVPADLVKSAREAERTGQAIGDFLNKEQVGASYGPPVQGCRFILHTDPAIPRRGGDGRMVIPELRWSDSGWTRRYAAFVCDVADTLAGRLEAVEMHPGAQVNDIDDMAISMMAFSDVIAARTSHRPLVVLENKYRQRVARAEEMLQLWDALPHDGRYGLVIDLPNLWRTHRSKWAEALTVLPRDAVRGMHLHWKHRAPGPDDPVNWSTVLAFVREHRAPLYLNPEVFHRSQLVTAMEMFRKELPLGSAWSPS